MRRCRRLDISGRANRNQIIHGTPRFERLQAAFTLDRLNRLDRPEKDILKIRTGEDAVSGPVRLLIRESKPAKARFLKIRAKNVGYCPAGSPGEGEKAWLFVDEIIVE